MFNRVQTVGSIRDFLSMNQKQSKIEDVANKKLVNTGIKVAVTVLAGSIILDVTLPAMAIHDVSAAMTNVEAVPVNAISDAFGKTVHNALQPLIDVLREVAKPIAGVMVTWGCLRYMIGQQEAGLQNMQQAAIGYILVQLSPVILKIITGVGDAVA